MNSRAKVAARVAVAACNAVDSGFFPLFLLHYPWRIAFGLMFGDSWVSVYLIVGLSKSSWKPCVCFLWAFLHSSLARVFHYYEIGIRIPFWYSNTIFHRDESSTVPVWGSIGLFVNVEVSSLVK